MNAQNSEFSRIVQMDELGDTALIQEVVATASERAALAKRFHLDGLGSLKAQVSLILSPTGEVRMTTTLTADMQQTCAVTLAPLKTHLSTEFTLIYSKDAAAYCEPEQEESDTSSPYEDPPEPLIDEKIDIGKAIAEQFSLEINPFPRVKGTVFNGFTTEREGEAGTLPEKKNPFAVLSQFKTKQKNKA